MFFSDDEIYNMVREGLARELIPQEVLDFAKGHAETLLTGLPSDVLRQMAASKIEFGLSLEEQIAEYTSNID